SIADNTSLSGIISSIAVAVLLVLCFRSIGMVVSALLTLAAGIVVTTAFGLLAVGSFNMISVAFAVLFIGIGIDFGIHVGLRYMEFAARSARRRDNLVAAGRSVGTALLLMGLGAAVGFFSFLPTDYRGVSELGLIAGFGMVAAFVANITLYPALIAVWPGLRAGQSRPVAPAAARGEAWQERHRRLILAISAILGVAALAFAGQARFDSNPMNLKDPHTESVATALELLGDPRLNVSSISVLAPSAEAVRPMAERLARLPSVAAVRTVADYVPADQDAKLDVLQDLALQLTPILTPEKGLAPPTALENVAALDALRSAARTSLEKGRAGTAAASLRRLLAALDRFLGREDGPPKLGPLAEDLVGGVPAMLADLKTALEARKFTLRDLPAGLRERIVSASGLYRIEVLPNGNTQDSRVLRRFVSEVSGVAPHATDGPVVELRAGDAIVAAFVTASVVAVAVIALGLLAILRRPLDVVLILAPIGLAAALTFGVAVATGLSFNFANVIVVPLLIGLGVSSAVHLVIRARRDRTAAALRSSTPRAVLFSALTTIASFASLALSSHWGQASMGLLLLIAMTANLFCFLVVLPALLGSIERRHGQS
ncbi:MAG: MMPL family transporter, partial [Rhodospirillaceae bacterium]|nr:MMPL family transporter [Rhodospirillaceae bacterium]